MNVLYNIFLMIYFFIIIPASGIALLHITDNVLIIGIVLIGVAVLHSFVVTIFFNADSKLSAVAFSASLVACLLYLDLGNIMLFIKLIR